MINTAIQKVTTKKDLTTEEMNQVIDEIMDGKASNVQITSLLTSLNMKEATIEEITGAARSMRDHALPFDPKTNTLDIVGTGGDHSNTFNISTTAAIVVASLNIPVTKHGNGAASSKSGAANLLESLGFNIHLDRKDSLRMLNEKHFCFLFAQKYHQAMKYVAPVRKNLAIRTIFNILGPLTNPAHNQSQLLGVYDEDLLFPMAKVANNLGITNLNVIFGTDGMDEASISAPTKMITIRNGEFKNQTIKPEDFDLHRYDKSEVIGGSPKENAQITREVLDGNPGAKREIVLLNAGLAINAFDEKVNIKTGIEMAKEAIDSGKAKSLLNELINFQ